jgi:Fur family zinc uptake transcriptional regulator
MQDGRKVAFPAPEHDHRHCVDQALTEAAELCRQRGVRLTPIRRRVLELVWASHKAVGAYEILDALRHEHAGAAPPTVYRALDFLIAQGFVHRIESLNAFVGCPHPADRHAGQFLICLDCGAAAELDAAALESSITDRASKLGFEVAHATLEVTGRCRHCQGTDAAGGPRHAR